MIKSGIKLVNQVIIINTFSNVTNVKYKAQRIQELQEDAQTQTKVLLLVYVIAAQFIYSRRDNPSGFAETLDEGYGYEDTEQSNYIISGHQLTGNEKGNIEKY